MMQVRKWTRGLYYFPNIIETIDGKPKSRAQISSFFLLIREGGVEREGERSPNRLCAVSAEPNMDSHEPLRS